MKIAMALFMGLFFVSTSINARVIKSKDEGMNCTKFEVMNKNKQSDGSFDFDRELNPNESVVSKKQTYHFSVMDREVNFDKRQVKVDINQHIIIGVNRSLLNRTFIIDESTEDMNNVLNETFKEFCVADTGHIIYVK